MTALVIFEMTALHDAEKMDEYRVMARPTLVAHKAKPLALRGKHETLEGTAIETAVVLQFESYEAALNWYNSPEYQACKKFREDAADINTMIIEGV